MGGAPVMNSINIRLLNPQQAYTDILGAWQWVKAMLTNGHRLILEIRLETRSDKQNKFLHAMLGDIAKQKEWAGKKRDTDTWKRLLTASWLRARGESIEILPALDGHGVDVVFRHTSKLNRGECAELCDYILSWCAENDVTLRDAVPWATDPETGEIRMAA